MKTQPMDAPVHAKTLVEQKTDFTAEGSPPPGKVVGSVPPVTTDVAPTKSAKKRPPRPMGPVRQNKYG